MNVLTWPTDTIDLRPNFGLLMTCLDNSHNQKYWSLTEKNSHLNRKISTIHSNIFFEFAKKINLIKNSSNSFLDLKKAKGQIRTNVSDPSNNNNLNERSLCLQKILSFPLFKIHYLSKSFFHLKKESLTQSKNSNRSTVEFLESIDECNHLRVDFNYLHVECFKKDFEMRINEYNNNSESVESNLLRLNSTKLNKTQQNFRKNQTRKAQWARDFIKTQRLKRGECKKNSAFSSLTIKEQQAIYYQLRRTNSIKCQKKSIQTSTTKKEIPIKSHKLAYLLVFQIIFSEFLTLKFSFVFYLSFGFDIVTSLIAALTVEIFFMIFGSSSIGKFKALGFLLFIYSMFTVSYSIFTQDESLIRENNQKREKISNTREKLSSLKRVNRALLGQQEALLKDMEVYRANELITKGRANLAPEKALLLQKITSNQNEISKTVQSLNEIQKNKNTRFKRLGNISPKTWALMAFLGLIQILSAISLREVSTYFASVSKKTRRAYK